MGCGERQPQGGYGELGAGYCLQAEAAVGCIGCGVPHFPDTPPPRSRQHPVCVWASQPQGRKEKKNNKEQPHTQHDQQPLPMVFISFFFPEKKKQNNHILHSWYKNKV